MPTRLPSQAQKFAIAQRQNGYKMRTLDINSIHHFVMNISLNMNDGGITYSNIYSTFNLLYPVIGTTSVSHGFNLINPITTTQTSYGSASGATMSWSKIGGSYLTYYNSPTQSDGFITLDGSTQYIDTSFSNTNLLLNNKHLSYYTTNNATGSGDDISTIDGRDKLVINYNNNGITYSSFGLSSATSSTISSTSSPSTTGLVEVSRSNYYSTWNKNGVAVGTTLSNGDLTVTGVYTELSSLGVSSSKWYWEVHVGSYLTGGYDFAIGIAKVNAATNSQLGTDANGWQYGNFANVSYKNYNNSPVAYGSAYHIGDTIGVALDMDLGSVSFYKNNVAQGLAFTFSTGFTMYAAVSSFQGNIPGPTYTANFGQNTFSYSVPSGFNSGLYNDGISIYSNGSGYTNNSYLITSTSTFSAGIYSTWNPNRNAPLGAYGNTNSFYNGNLISVNNDTIFSTIGKSSGKWFWEVKILAASDAGFAIGIGTSRALGGTIGGDGTGYTWAYVMFIGVSYKDHTNSRIAYGTSFGVGDTIGIALDMDNGTLIFYKNGVSQGIAYTGLLGIGNIYAACGNWLSSPGPGTMSLVGNFGQNTFSYSVPAGYNPGLYEGQSLQIGRGPDGYSNRTFAMMSAGTKHSPDQAFSLSKAVNNLMINKNTPIYATLDPLKIGDGAVLSNNNLIYAGVNTTLSTIGVSSGKWYWEATLQNTINNYVIGISSTISGIYTSEIFNDSPLFYNLDSYGIRIDNNVNYSYSVNSLGYNQYGTNPVGIGGQGAIIGLALNADTRQLSYYHNGSFLVTSNVSSFPVGTTWYAAVSGITASSTTFSVNFGQGAFSYTPPAGYNRGFYNPTLPGSLAKVY